MTKLAARSRTKSFRRDAKQPQALESPELLRTLLLGLSDGLAQIVAKQIGIRGHLCRTLCSAWQAPKFQKNLRDAIRIALATALDQKIPGELADPIAAVLTDEIFYPAVKALGDALVRGICRTNRKASFSSPRTAARTSL